MKTALRLWLSGWRVVFFMLATLIPTEGIRQIVFNLPIEHQHTVWIAVMVVVGPLIFLGIFRLFYPSPTHLNGA